MLARGTWTGIGFSLLVVLFTLPSCEETVTPSVAPAGRRDYSWTFDTLRARTGDTFALSKIWGSSPRDMWAVGDVPSADLSKWRFDGDSWQRDTQRISAGLFSLWGLSANDVWTNEVYGNPDVGVWRFDGVSWNSMGRISSTGPDVVLNTAWGDHSDNLYFVGATGTLSISSYQGLVIRYDGNAFRQIPIRNERTQFTEIRRDIRGTGRYYLIGRAIAESGDSARIYELSGSSLRMINVVRPPASLGDVDGQVYFSFDKKIIRIRW
jgi:hypothetical protein